MNNEQSIPVQGTETKTLDIEQRKQLIEKLSAEYAGVKDRVGKLHAFLCDIDIEKKVPDYEERSNLREQLGIMLNYLENLRRRIGFHERMVFGQMINETTHRIEIKGMREPTFDSGIGVRCDKCGKSIRPGDMCIFHNEKIFCNDCGCDNSETGTAPHHCGQDASCQVGDGSAVVNEVPDSIKSLEGMQVIKVCGPKCKDCPCGDGLREYPSGRDASSCVKVELVGGYYLCLTPLPNSIVTE